MAKTYSQTCRADLHSHSTASDGRLSPAQLVTEAAAAGVELLALTDHDTLAGVSEARQAAAAAGLGFVSGVEISVTWENRTLHIVGLGIDPDNQALCEGLTGIQQIRRKRAEQIAIRLEKLGGKQVLRAAQQQAKSSQLTRTHFARVLVDQGLAADMKQAFKRYLGAGKPANVRAQWPDLATALDWIHQAGGLAVLAHPLRYGLSGAWRRRMLQAFKAAGGDALEVSAGASQQAEDLRICTRAALEYDLLASAGSDFHGPEQHWLKLGRLAPLSTRLTPVWTRLALASAA